MSRHADPVPRVHAVVPVKRLAGAKSRLAPGVSAPQREALVLAMLVDTLRALRSSPPVSGLTVVTPDARAATTAARCGAEVLDEHAALTHRAAQALRSGRHAPGSAPADGLNAVLTGAAGVIRDRTAPSHLVFVQADLPALRSDEFTAATRTALTSAPVPARAGLRPAGTGRAFVADRSGDGTTAVFVCGNGTEVRLGFGAHSARWHAADGARALAGQWPGLRTDVDTVADLRRVRDLGAGPATAAASEHIVTAEAHPR